MITHHLLSSFINAASSGDIDQIEHIFAGLTPKASLQLIRKKEYHEAFYEAVAHNHVEISKRLIEFLNKTMRSWSRDYTIDSNSWTSVLPHGDGARALIQADDYAVCRVAAQKGYLSNLRDMVTVLSPDDIKEMLVLQSYALICRAAESGVVEMLDYVLSLAKNDVFIVNMLTENLYAPLRIASYCHHVPMLKRLLAFSFVFAHAEQNAEVYNQYIELFVEEKLAALHATASLARAQDANAYCDVSPDDGLLYFYMMRWLIRCNQPRYFNELRFLMTFPSIYKLLHVPVTPNYPNELLSLAEMINHQVAVQLLMSVPAVRQLHQEQAPKADALNHLLKDHETQPLQQVSKPTSGMRSKLYNIIISQHIEPQETNAKLLVASGMFQSQGNDDVAQHDSSSLMRLGYGTADESV